MQKISVIVSILLVLLFNSTVFGQEDSRITELVQQSQQYESSGDMVRAAEVLNKLGYSYWENNMYEKAIDAFSHSIVLNQKIENKNAIMNLYTNIGMVYTDLNQIETALLYFRKSLMIRREFGDKQLIVTGLLNMATPLQKLERYDESIKMVDEALEFSKLLNEIRLMKR